MQGRGGEMQSEGEKAVGEVLHRYAVGLCDIARSAGRWGVRCRHRDIAWQVLRVSLHCSCCTVGSHLFLLARRCLLWQRSAGRGGWGVGRTVPPLQLAWLIALAPLAACAHIDEHLLYMWS